MKRLEIKDLIHDTQSEIRHLVCKMELADVYDNKDRYIEYADSIVEKINEIKRLKRIAKFYEFIEKIKTAIGV